MFWKYNGNTINLFVIWRKLIWVVKACWNVDLRTDRHTRLGFIIYSVTSTWPEIPSRQEMFRREKGNKLDISASSHGGIRAPLLQNTNVVSFSMKLKDAGRKRCGLNIEKILNNSPRHMGSLFDISCLYFTILFFLYLCFASCVGMSLGWSLIIVPNSLFRKQVFKCS